MKISRGQIVSVCPKCVHLDRATKEDYANTLHAGVSKAMDDITGQIKSIYFYVVSTIMVIALLFVATYLVVRCNSSFRHHNNDSHLRSFHRRSAPADVVDATSLVNSKKLYAEEPDRRATKLIALDLGVTDVHYVFISDSWPSWMSMCSLESAVSAVGDNGRVNVFLVNGTKTDHQKQKSVELLASLEGLSATYGNRLNVVNVDLEECLDCSPFRGLNLDGRTALAKFVVELVLLWQFGGTVLDAGVVAVHGHVYRASGTAVEYDHQEISSPIACHDFIYNAMLCTKDFIIDAKKPFGTKSGRWIMDKTVKVFRYATKDVRPLNERVVCKNGVVTDYCYYVEADHVEYYDTSYVHSFCPVVWNTSQVPA
ncbi:uncharacterized protein LOC126835701 [Adelges cooleyi]|uniref:uncharacterized protein LOC126835701 n=1 Tax=Adelges cooleyi TaxID=133065 RepID=UPI0021806363|nr:uncharacterized protein LOC126835701 [Adelges cooleyi]XP_050424413.1 uncharacterized protein LOC126835701 [Adelges cooleyi]XP_050424414.1 uncharacterized protein LOC126835701 [Adelges cooleyi]XP_050424415.1 uncharacterized protein LOC126835701 [Adelges cooleyi]XP_050424416.1 uncharacterized protein LOC126835701 [Adelges cooleyi]XP_050424417.1 uncharacterized protein LOC126835701 [Adelges cooleyi]